MTSLELLDVKSHMRYSTGIFHLSFQGDSFLLALDFSEGQTESLFGSVVACCCLKHAELVSDVPQIVPDVACV